eukprot:scaffold15520_cov76-Skeletonema_marinoi.AAC.5
MSDVAVVAKTLIRHDDNISCRQHVMSGCVGDVLVCLPAVPNWASSGHLRRCSDANTTGESLSLLLCYNGHQFWATRSCSLIYSQR